MNSEFIVDSSYQGYVYVGHAEGRFENDKKEMQPYFNLYVISPVSSWSSEDYCAFGFKAEKKSCATPVWKDLNLQPGDRIKLFFDDRKKVVMAAFDQ